MSSQGLSLAAYRVKANRRKSLRGNEDHPKQGGG